MPKIMILKDFNPRVSDLGWRVALISEYGFVDFDSTSQRPKITPRKNEVKYSKFKVSLQTAALHEALQRTGRTMTVNAAYKVGKRLGLCRRGTGRRLGMLEKVGFIATVKNDGARPGHVLSIA